jgi:hypothetical protein
LKLGKKVDTNECKLGKKVAKITFVGYLMSRKMDLIEDLIEDLIVFRSRT